jgi:hypothetical protein
MLTVAWHKLATDELYHDPGAELGPKDSGQGQAGAIDQLRVPGLPGSPS